MTQNEKIALESSAQLMRYVATIFADLSSKSSLMLEHFPNLSAEQKRMLRDCSRTYQTVSRRVERQKDKLESTARNNH